jgi:hypothetical protein
MIIPFGESVEKGDMITQEDLDQSQKFQRMLHDFEEFAGKSSDPFAPCGFLHKLLDTALERAYAEAYNAIGKAQDPQPFICAATHLKRCKEISKEMTEQISAAMGDMHRGGSRDHDMMSSVQNLIRMISNGR